MKQILFIFLSILLVSSSWAQNKAEMSNYQQQLLQLFEKVQHAPTDNERYNANEQAVLTLADALDVDESIRWNWNLGTFVSVLTSPDKKFRVFTWPVVNDQGEYECFGFVQAYDEKEDTYITYALNDKSEEIINVEESVLDPTNWYGAVYQQLIQTTHEGRNYYTLLGWSGTSPLIQRKVIEPILFKNGSSKPQFGQAVFRREKNLRRVVLQYSSKAMVNLNYSDQFTRTISVKRVKTGSGKSSRTSVVKENNDTKSAMIIFDEVAPQIVGMEGLFQYYMPTGVEMAYIFVNGRWELHDNAQGRVPNNKLNKEFEPLEKTAPAYQVPR